MPGNLSIPFTFQTQSGNVPASELDTDYSTIATYVNAREITLGLFAARPAAGTAGRLYVATDISGGTLYEDNGSVWTQIAAGVTPSFSGITAHQVVISEGAAAAVGLALTKGQILVGQTGADPVALAIGADGLVLTLDSATAAGVKWAAAGGTTAGFNLGLYYGLQPTLVPVL